MRARAVLRALCDAWYPQIQESAGAAAVNDVAAAVERWLSQHAVPGDARQVRWLLGALSALGFARRSHSARVALLHTLYRLPRLRTGLEKLRGVAAIHYLGSEANGSGSAWPGIGYPGAPTVADARDELGVVVMQNPGDELAADACVVGSGAGGSVIAAELARAGLEVIVLESGGAYTDAAYPTDDAAGMSALYWRGGPAPTRGGNVTVLAGATLGGGTTINWMNCVLPPQHVRASWAREHGLDGIDGAEFDADLAYVLERIGANAECSAYNGPNRRLAAGAERLGWSHRRAVRNVDRTRYREESAGFVGYGDRSGAKQSAVNTFLEDASRCGARIVAGCHAERILMRAGRAAGVVATLRDARGERSIRVNAATVVVAAGALETPALLLRSALGGGHVGRHLHLHPVTALAAVYPEILEPWIGAPQTVIVDEFAQVEDGFGFLVECPHFSAGLFAAAMHWTGTAEDGQRLALLKRTAGFIGLVRDRGSGRVTLDRTGRARVHYAVTDPLDRRNLDRSLERMYELHLAAGAEQLLPLDGKRLFSAHQMGTARMGADPRTSVTAPTGELHDARGVWIGDTSAFPSAVGSNPMVTCQALARRTARAIAAR